MRRFIEKNTIVIIKYLLQNNITKGLSDFYGDIFCGEELFWQT